MATSQPSHRKSLTSRRVSSLETPGPSSAPNLTSDTAAAAAAAADLDAVSYSYAIRSALLTHLLQPRSRRLQHLPAPAATKQQPYQRTSLSINELVKDFSLIRDSKSTKFPNGYLNELDKRITGVLVGKERMPEYQDSLVKRTFAAFLNEFKNPTFRKSMEKDRRVEDLLLIFFSKATSELQKGRSPEDDSWKLMVDRHVALFVRLIGSTLKTNDWARERPELTARLHVIESKLLDHSQDLADHLTGAGGTTVEVEVPISYAVKDMPGVLHVATLFDVAHDQVQADINLHKEQWSARAALRDLKQYQMHLSIDSATITSRRDFASQEAYDSWKKAEIHDLSQMMLAIIRVYPDLAKTSTASIPGLHSPSNTGSLDSGCAELLLQNTNSSSECTLDPASAMNRVSLHDEISSVCAGACTDWTFVPPDPRACFVSLAKKALETDLVGAPSDDRPVLSKASVDILGDVSARWRLPLSSRRVLLLEAIQDIYRQRKVTLETLELALSYGKEALFDAPTLPKKASMDTATDFFDRSRWVTADQTLNQLIVHQLNTAVLRDLVSLLQHCYESKPPSIGPAMYVLEHHVGADPAFTQTPTDLDRIKSTLNQTLHQRALDAYNLMVTKHVAEDAAHWSFSSIIQLGEAVTSLETRIQKRYKNNPNILSVNPLTVLTEAMVPAFSKDAQHIVERVIELAASNNEELSIQDGFQLYREMVSIRSTNQDMAPHVAFEFDLEKVLAPFVWRWVAVLNEKIVNWVGEAVKHDQFQTSAKSGDDTPTDKERHSSSAIDIFRIFRQSADQLIQLRWADDLQHAKFMTAVSKSIGSSIARYCELLEQRFMKEMDRNTPEQEAAVGLSRQEKWVQLAKETLSTKERVEPFQFAPESLVKLNDIEYTTLQLDELSKMMDVDVCAEKMRQHEPLVPKHRQLNRYVFTIKIIEAEDLKSCDSNGLSDPYVVIGDEYQKRLAKTRIIYANLNPRWDETVDISTSGPLHIVATIWDWDSLGDHDCVGRTSLKLDPAHFSDFLPREFWLDLDTQGRLLLRISMEGERDDIQFYFGKAFRTLKRTERDMTRKITDKVSRTCPSSFSRVYRDEHCEVYSAQGLSISSVKAFAGGFANSYFPKAQLPPSALQKTDAVSALKPLFEYFDENFAIMKQTLTDAAMISVMTRVWKEALTTVESLLVPPLSDKPSTQQPLSQQEVDIVYRWLQLLFEFFNADGEGVPLDVLRSPKYHDLQNLNFFYSESTDNLIRTSENMTAATSARRQNAKHATPGLNRFSAPSSLSAGGPYGGAPGLFGMPSTRRSKTIMMSRNLGTIRKAKENKWKDAQAEPSDDMIMRILRMRPEAERYLRDRSRQRERLAAHAAAEQIVQQSILAQRRPVGGQRRMPSMH